jgi:hypothetical protein
MNCSALTSITIPDTVLSSVPDYGFYNCRALESAVLGNGITSIGSYAFGQCGLRFVQVGENVITISNTAFIRSGLQSITLPESIQSIGETAFNSSMKNIYVPWSEGEIAGAPWGASNATVYYNIGV